jgi:hypothetical protein
MAATTPYSTLMTKLSPDTQVVLAAIHAAPDNTRDSYRSAGAAALRAAVEQALPLTKTPWGSTLMPILTAQESRNKLLAIAAELEALNG